MNDLQTSLNQFFGFQTFRPGQEEIVRHLLAGENVLGILPTGSGKTLTYALPALMRPGLTLVISPLISLMEDQVQRLNKIQKNCAVFLNSQENLAEQTAIIQHLSQFKFLLLSPEMFQKPQILHRLAHLPVQLAVIDEAHCISQWGFDFRPEYLFLKENLQKINQPQILALSATVTPMVKKDIGTFLFSGNFMTEKFPVERKNIGYIIEQCLDEQNRFEKLSQLLKTQHAAGIIYCNTRKKTETLTKSLQQQGLLCSFYHGGLTSLERKKLQAQFQAGQLQVMIATNAFGMGIDKPDIRFVIHYEQPATLEEYVQETGRCSRDGQPGFALMYVVTGDEAIHQHFAKRRKENIPELAQTITRQNNSSQTLAFLNQKADFKTQQQDLMQDFIAEKNCLRQQIANYFHDPKPEQVEKCCSFHGLKTEDYPSNQRPTLKENPANWQQRLANLFPKVQ
ncbi:RecQ family ATP-dependent DNA helicase [Enterococcus timonensis]|uniref:RecQ family ATP-dependent DNA helicase n=1 Tax=Enterococcus timonensis TaxID=1852364 RepID=UPI0008DAAC97|nr:RecQ family ATP-dependent DNA helicase [Enterococcus timonensis]